MKKLICFSIILFCLIACKKNNIDDGGNGNGNGNNSGCKKLNKTGSFSLPDKRHVYTTVVLGNKIVFAGGFASGVDKKTVDIYDAGTKVWSTTQLSEARYSQVGLTAGDKMFFATYEYAFGTTYTGFVDVYNTTTNTWTKLTLSEGRAKMAIGTVGNKVLFAGGENNLVVPSKKVDVYDVATGALTQTNLSEARKGVAAGTSGNRLFFAGGQLQNGTYSKKVDIYDASTNAWDSVLLSEARTGLDVISAGDKILFVGGQKNGGLSTTVDIYDAQSRTITSKQLTHSYSNLSSGDLASTAGNKIVLCCYDSKQLDIYDASTNTWSTKQLTASFDETRPVVAGTKIIFAGGHNGTQYAKNIDVFDAGTGNLVTVMLSEAREDMGTAVIGNKVIFAGGQTSSSPSVTTIDIYDVENGGFVTLQLSKSSRFTVSALAAGNQLLLAIPGDPTYETNVDIFSLVNCN